MLSQNQPTNGITYVVEGAAPLARCLSQPALLSVDSALATCLQRLRSDGYLEASIDAVQLRHDTVFVEAHLGRLYALGNYSGRASTSEVYGPVTADTLSTPKSLAALLPEAERYTAKFGRSGYPFARLRFEQFKLDTAELSVGSASWSGPYITYGGLRLGGLERDAPVNLNYLERTLRVGPGQPFRADQLPRIEQRLRGIPFLQVGRSPVVAFESGRALLYLDVQARPTSRFDFLLGFLPNSAANDGQLLLTGDVTLELENALKRGERLFFSFERLQPEVTEVVLEAAYPYLLGSPFGVRTSFGLYRQASEWLRLEYEVGGAYAFGGSDAYELYYTGGNTQVLGFDTAAVKRTQQLPELLDAKRDGFGLRLRLDRRDDPLDTRRGWRLTTDVSASLRTVSVPNSVRELGDVLALRADTAAATTGQYRANLDAAGFVPVGRRATVALLIRAAAITGDARPLRNELFRIGGNRLLRGFDEQTIGAQAYAVSSVEYRLLLGGGSYLFGFVDQAVVNDPYRVGADTDAPTGFGAGLRLATKAGALGLTYAYGRRGGAPVDWQRAKVHVGYASRF